MLRRPRHLRRGLTIVELLIAMIITSMLALGVASILQAATYGTSSKREIRRLAVRSQQTRLRFDDAIRSARAVLACGEASGGEKYLVLWKADTNQTDKDKVNLSELQLIEWVPKTKTVTAYKVPSVPNPDPSYAAGSDFYDQADKARDSGALTGTVWSRGISACALTLVDDLPGRAPTVTWAATVVDELLSESLVSTASLRSFIAPK